MSWKRSIFLQDCFAIIGRRFVFWLLICVLVVSAWSYAKSTFDGLTQAQVIVMGLQEKPFVYRALVPWLAHLLVIIGFRANMALSIVIVCSAVGLFYGIKYLLPPSDELRVSLIAFTGVEIFMQAFFLNAKPYDLSTAMFFAFCLGFLARNNFKAFYGLFLMGCLNRETMFLLTIFFAIWFLKKMNIDSWILGMGFQSSIFVGVRLMLMKIFEENPGTAFHFNPWKLLSDYWQYSAWTLSMLAVLGLVCWLIALHWKRKPAFLRCALVIIFPLLMVLHILFGWAFEIRVFAELSSVVVALGAWEFVDAS